MNTAMRRDRLLNLLHRGATTVPAVAATLGVSERTAYRDISVLREQGHRIHATPGPGGGVRLAPNARPRPVHFEVSEIIGLALSVAILRATPGMPFAQSAEAALDRARRALSADRQRTMIRLQRRILIGEPSSESVRGSLGEVDPSLLSAFEQAFTGGRSMSFGYVDRFDKSSQRRIECVALLLRSPAWYMIAWDLDKDAPRTFRMDRIRNPTCGAPLDEKHPLPEVLHTTCPDAESVPITWLGRPLA